MKQAAFLTLLACTCWLPGVARAASFLDAFVPLGRPAAAPAATPLIPGCGCADLSGAWMGACSLDGKDQAKGTGLTVVQASCERITVNGEQLPIGGQQTATLTLSPVLCAAGGADALSNRAMTSASASHADWNADKTGLLLTANSTTRNIGGDVASTLITGTLRLESAHLLLDVQGQTSANKPFTVSCSFEK